MTPTPHLFDIAAESVGFVSSIALTWQSYRLVRHLRAVRDLRRLAERQPSSKIRELAEEGASTLEKTIARWDARDQWLVVGLIGVTLSFLLNCCTKVVGAGFETAVSTVLLWMAKEKCSQCGGDLPIPRSRREAVKEWNLEHYRQ
jgi:hypothetical protein